MSKRRKSRNRKAIFSQRIPQIDTQTMSENDINGNDTLVAIKSDQDNAVTGSRRTHGKQRDRVLAGVIGLIGVGIIGFFLLNAGSTDISARSIPQERLDLDPLRGNPDATVSVIEYGAFACPSCRAWHNAGIIEQILDEFSGQVNFIYRDFPVISPTYDRMSAELAQCALDQGQDQFWTLHDALYTIIRPGESRDIILRTARQLGLDDEAIRSCAENETHQDTVEYDFNRGRNLGLPGTPSWLIRSNITGEEQRIFDATPEILRAAIEQALLNS